MNEPPFAEYPRPSVGTLDRGPGIYFDSIGEAWKIVRKDLGIWIAATLVLFIGIAAFIGPVVVVTTLLVPPKYPGEFNPLASLLQVVLGLIPNSLLQMLICGMIGMGVRQLRGERIDLGMMFDPFRRFGPVFVSCLLFTLISNLAFAAFLLPALYFIPVLTLMPAVAFLKGLDAKEALALTYQRCKPYWLGLLGLLFVVGFVAGLGACACGIGLLFTYPIFFVVLAIHYRAFFESGPTTTSVPF